MRIGGKLSEQVRDDEGKKREGEEDGEEVNSEGRRRRMTQRNERMYEGQEEVERRRGVERSRRDVTECKGKVRKERKWT